MIAEEIKIESEENGFHLVVDGERWLIADPEALYDHVKASIGPWLYEMYAAKATMPPSYDVREAYDPSDPKHSDWHSVHADIWDMREKNPDEYEYLREASKREAAGEEA